MYSPILRLLLLTSTCVAASIASSASFLRSRAEPISARYIVQLRPSTDVEQHLAWVKDMHRRVSDERSIQGRSPLAGVGKDLRIGSDFRAYTGQFDEKTISTIRQSGDVLLVEQDQKFHISTHEDHASMHALKDRDFGQTSVGYNLRMISQRPPASKDQYCYLNECNNRFAYIIDTGIKVSHPEFEGRASQGYNAISGVTFEDTDGHGTHVAGIVGSRTYGVCKKAWLISVKVISGNSGSTSVILDGFSWAVNDIINRGRVGHAVLNFSIGGGYSQVVNNAVDSAYNKGILCAVAAGGEAQDVKNVSPASAANAITVGAIDSSYRKASSSNYGAGMDIFAPGVSITSTWIGSTGATNTISGTSVAAPHLAGLVLYFQTEKPGSSAKNITDTIIKIANKNAISGVPSGTANLLAYNGCS